MRMLMHNRLNRVCLLLGMSFLLAQGLMAQDSLQTVIAKEGDGIFSLLRDHGIEISKYYEAFLALNGDKVKNGSELILGAQYRLPHAPDSFKNMGRKIQFPDEKEIAIFSADLASLKRIDSTLKHTVYYLITDYKGSKEVQDEIAKRMARKLLQRNARVYLLDNVNNDSLNLMDLTSIINKKYLRHNGDYQRLLLISSNELSTRSKANVTVYHNGENEESKRMANNILMMFGKNLVKQKTLDEYAEEFTDLGIIAFTKNMLPTVTLIEIGQKTDEKKKTLKVASNKNYIADLIANGILSDYSSLEFEDK